METFFVGYIAAWAIACVVAVWLTAKRVPRSLAVLLVVAAMVGLGTGIAALVGTSVNSFSQNIPAYQSRLQEETSALIAWLDKHPKTQLLVQGHSDAVGGARFNLKLSHARARAVARRLHDRVGRSAQLRHRHPRRCGL